MNYFDWTALVVGLTCCFGVLIYYSVKRLVKGRRNPLVGKSGRVLFVTAHPDDECMFFAPTIRSLTRSGQYDVFVLCLSSGNYYQQGRTRQQELLSSCVILGIRQSNVFVVDRSDMPDDPNVSWSSDVVAKVVADYVKNYLIDMIFTFDSYGISGHLNHASVHKGVKQFLNSRDCPQGVCGYQLVSVNIVRKYLAFLELTISYLTSKIIYISSWSDIIKTQTAMYAHCSQFVWFRVLYVIFSRYVYVNSYTPIKPLPLSSIPASNGQRTKK